jgi:SAM-dependent methyltransferase
MTCPFCLSADFSPSWLKLRYLGRLYTYLECRECGSLVCDPMPDADALKSMYGADYFEDEPTPERFRHVLAHLNGERGVLMDYGCGIGSLLALAAEKGFTPIGVEFHPDVVRSLNERGFMVVLPDEECEPADVLHLGDVIEHLTDINAQLPAILSRLKPGGTFIAHNPLEGNMNLFARAIKLSRRLQGEFEDAPRHVTLGTTEGYRRLFERFGLTELVFEVTEVPWPAPETFRDGRSVRQLGLYAIRRLSQFVSRIRGVYKFGNRLLYVGRKP